MDFSLNVFSKCFLLTEARVSERRQGLSMREMEGELVAIPAAAAIE